MERIDKILASENFGSRKQVHKLLKSKAITVNGVVCTDSSQKVQPETGIIAVNGKELTVKKPVYYDEQAPGGVKCRSGQKGKNRFGLASKGA